MSTKKDEYNRPVAGYPDRTVDPYADKPVLGRNVPQENVRPTVHSMNIMDQLVLAIVRALPTIAQPVQQRPQGGK